MRKIANILDSLLNGITMYRLVLYGLCFMAAVAFFFGFLGAVPFSPIAMLLLLLVLMTSGFLVNTCFKVLLNVPANYESSIITTLILFFILEPTTDAHTLFLAAGVTVVAIASKYIIAIRGKHIFNPAAIALVLFGLFGQYIGLWWVANPSLMLFAAIVGLLVVRKLRRFQMFLVFIIAALATMLVVGITHDQSIVGILKVAFTSWPIIFFGTIMLTEPATMPIKLRHQYIYALGVGVLFASQWHLGAISTTPQLVLALGNLYAFIVNPKYHARLILSRVTQLSDQVYDFTFTTDRKIAFKPGQYMDWTLPIPLLKTDGRGNRRTFSIASSPTEDMVHLGIKVYQPSSVFKQTLLAMKEGDSIMVGRVAGEFTLPKDTSLPLLCIAGGIGITPFRSMLKFLVDTSEKRDIVLIYLVRNETEVSYRDILEAAEAQGVKVIIHTGIADAHTIQEYVPDYAKRQIYISGPNAMVMAYRDAMHRSGVGRKQIVTDYFTGY